MTEAGSGRKISGWRSPARRCAAPALVLALGLAGGGCSVSMPIASLVGGDDDKPTHSIAAKASPLSPDLGTEDWRRARGALAVALDPQGNGTPVTWDNPDTALKGTFAPVGQPFVKNDEICRAFIASIAGQGATQWLQGSACRLSGGEWTVKDAKPWKKPA